MVLKPEKSFWGYRVDSIETEEWNNEYVERLKQLEKKAYEVGVESVTVDQLQANNEEEKREKAEADCWINERKEILKIIEKKYPNEKDKIIKHEKKWWDSIEKGIEKDCQINVNDSEDEKKKKRLSAILNKGGNARERVYYLIGKYLTEENN